MNICGIVGRDPDNKDESGEEGSDSDTEHEQRRAARVKLGRKSLVEITYLRINSHGSVDILSEELFEFYLICLYSPRLQTNHQ